MRIVFLGTPDFAVPSLERLVLAGHEILAVVAQPDARAGRGQRIRRPATVLRALELGLPVRQPRAIHQGPFREWFERTPMDLAVVVAYGRILKPWHLQAPRLGCINVHASLLPRWRGAAPVHHAILAGDEWTGVSIMQMGEGLDDGDVRARRSTPIGPDETLGELWARLARLGADLLIETLDALPDHPPVPQDPTGVTLAPPLTRSDGRIDWGRPARWVHDRVRGLDPWPGAWTEHRGQPMKVWRVRPLPGESAPREDAAGRVVEAGGRLIVACGVGAVELLEAQLPGGRRLPARDLLAGRALREGERLGIAEGASPP